MELKLSISLSSDCQFFVRFSTDKVQCRKYGTYRPNLAKLVASNSDEAVLSATRSAFATYDEGNDAYVDSIKALTELKGVGPATASLLLSCYDPDRVPFFSDELIRYIHWVRANGQGWDRKIKYNLSEYKEMFEKLQGLREKLQKESGNPVSALDLEKVAYVLGKESHSKTLGLSVLETNKDRHGVRDDSTQNPRSTKKRKGPTNQDANTKDKEAQQASTKRRTRGSSEIADVKDDDS